MASPTSPASSTSSAASRASFDQDHNQSLTLEHLVNHFVAAKRSLNTQTVLWRATDIVSTARELLEENAVLAAKNTSIRNIVEQQVDSLEAVRRGMDVVESEVQAEFKQILHDVDTSFAGLNSTLAVLRETPIEAVLQPYGTPQKHLYDFIDSATVSNLEGTLRACIDRYNEAHNTLDESSDAFDTSLDNLHSSMENVPITPATTSTPSPIPTLYHHLEGHAKEAAQAFQSLVQHYDLCITALRHTEGGSAAATQATGDAPVHSADDGAAPPEPMSEEERRDMLNVLQKDAREVEDVVTEIQERGSEMTFLLSQIENHVNHLRSEASALSSILQMISQITGEVKAHIATSRAFHVSWLQDTRPNLLNGIDEWENQRDFYERFDLAYAELLVEISSRRRRHEKAKRKAEEAQKELDRLRLEDERAREQFTLAQGDFLPLDIWPGLRDPPRQYEVRVVPSATETQHDNLQGGDEWGEDQEGGGVQSIPQLGRNVVERALTRVKRRM
ncbi:kinase activator [Stemphylium lycopersici]|uniref:Autophagy-related protein 17 n=1 Tax=Stemphylium lycopersici TaxID=183478 RepID=A0A364N9J7_STELY|nr:kinase activator [Stemphylium lycopersici]RAR03936.1 kinase activator [Stemphylium lycopersici]RAR13867.1 kinase activator [Stemphylium lycopersici]